jgi:hypothetical protein
VSDGEYTPLTDYVQEGVGRAVTDGGKDYLQEMDQKIEQYANSDGPRQRMAKARIVRRTRAEHDRNVAKSMVQKLEQDPPEARQYLYEVEEVE